MFTRGLPVGSFVVIAQGELQGLIDRLRALGYRVVGPQVVDGAVMLDDLRSVAQLPRGQLDVQDAGRYRLRDDPRAGYFDYVVGPRSLKDFVFPPRETLLAARREGDSWRLETPPPVDSPVAVLGARSCDLHALAIQDRVFLQGAYVDPAYHARREKLFLAAVNCRRAAATCFCHSMKTGPAVKSGFDLALTELDDLFVVEVGSQRGGEVLTTLAWSPCTADQLRRAKQAPVDLARDMARRAVAADDGAPLATAAAPAAAAPPPAVGGDGATAWPTNASSPTSPPTRALPAAPAGPAMALAPAQPPRQRQLDTSDIHDLLLNNLEHPQWRKVAERCLACSNCTLVCPTCFCSTVEEVPDLTGDQVERRRQWASCFTADHSYMNSGTVRKAAAARYRQWLTHKLASWIDQFGVSGCVGCGRCVTWCPVGIDLTEEVAAIREGS